MTNKAAGRPFPPNPHGQQSGPALQGWWSLQLDPNVPVSKFLPYLFPGSTGDWSCEPDIYAVISQLFLTHGSSIPLSVHVGQHHYPSLEEGEK